MRQLSDIPIVKTNEPCPRQNTSVCGKCYEKVMTILLNCLFDAHHLCLIKLCGNALLLKFAKACMEQFDADKKTVMMHRLHNTYRY